MTDAGPERRPISLAVVMIVTGILGWYAAFALTLDKFAVLMNPDAVLDCNYSLVVQCGANLQSWQGSLFGFPNPVLGLAGWMVPIIVGVAILAGARFARWFWITFAVFVAAALAFCIWLMSQSIFVLGTLCIWCMLTWAVTIVLFWTLSSHIARRGMLGAGLVRAGSALYGWVPALTIGSYIVIAVIAQLRLDVLSYL